MYTLQLITAHPASQYCAAAADAAAATVDARLPDRPANSMLMGSICHPDSGLSPVGCSAVSCLVCKGFSSAVVLVCHEAPWSWAITCDGKLLHLWQLFARPCQRRQFTHCLHACGAFLYKDYRGTFSNALGSSELISACVIICRKAAYLQS